MDKGEDNGSDIIVKCVDLKKTYILGEVKVEALRGINMEIRRGEMVAIQGPSGCGKTTLLNIIGSLDCPTSGKILLEGREISAATERELTEIRRKSVGFVFQFYNLLPVLTALENVELPMLIAGISKEKRNQRALDLLEKMALLDRKDHKPDELSGGERQRVAIARALANNPSILLADEPTGDLDTETGLEVLALLKEINKTENQTLVLVSHDSNIAKNTNRIFHIRDGTISSVEEV